MKQVLWAVTFLATLMIMSQGQAAQSNVTACVDNARAGYTFYYDISKGAQNPQMVLLTPVTKFPIRCIFNPQQATNSQQPRQPAILCITPETPDLVFYLTYTGTNVILSVSPDADADKLMFTCAKVGH
jgi:hypothetical protein